MDERDERPTAGGSAEETYRRNLELIQSAIDFVSRTMHLSEADREDFVSSVHLKLIEDDYGVLRKFQGVSTLKTYLVAVVKRFGLDFRSQKWGRWRPSLVAKRLGTAGVALETLISRDGRPLGEAMAEATARGLGTPEELEEIAAQLPVRYPRRFDSDEQLEARPGPGPTPLQQLRRAERARLQEDILKATREASSELEDQDQLILRMNFEDGVSVAVIARVLGLDQKQLYRRRQRILGSLRRGLEKRGFRRRDVSEILPDWNNG